jgi:hypothetical protein
LRSFGVVGGDANVGLWVLWVAWVVCFDAKKVVDRSVGDSSVASNPWCAAVPELCCGRSKGSCSAASIVDVEQANKPLDVMVRQAVPTVWPMRCAVLCCAVLCCAVLCCAVLCCAVLCCAVLCCAALCCAVVCCGML